MNSKTYTLPNGKKAVFEYDVCGIGKITLECMDELMGMITDRPQGKWIMHIDDLFPCESTQEWSVCHAEQLINGNDDNFCPNCGARMKGADDETDRR